MLNISPPLNMNPRWLGGHAAYTMSKYGMNCCVCWAAEMQTPESVHRLWPRTAIATAAVQNLLGGGQSGSTCRSPEIMADAAVEILTSPGAEVNGKCLIDSDVLRAAGMQDLSRYGGGDSPIIDIFVDR